MLGISKGYFNVCELDKEAFRPLGAELTLHAPIGRLQIYPKRRLVLDRGLANLLGFSREMFEPIEMHIANKPHRLITHREICVHLAEVSMSESLHNGRPSTLLKSIPVENERCGGGRTESFPVLQYKRLASGPFSQLTLTILDTGGRFRLFECSPTHKKKWVTRVAQEMPWGGFSRSRGYRGIRKGCGRGPAVHFRAVRQGCTAQEWGGAQKLGELIDVDVSYAVPRRLHTLAFTGSKWIAFADPTQQTGWLIDIRISSPYVATEREHKNRKMTNAGTRLCS